MRQNQRDGYSEIPILFKFHGKFENIVTFFNTVSRIDHFVMFRDIEVRYDASYPYLIMSMTLVGYQM